MTRFHPDKNKSQIVFDISGGEKEFKTMTMSTIPKEKQIVRSRDENYGLRTDDIEGAQVKRRNITPRDTFFNTRDIQGSQSKPAVDLSKKPIDIMSVDDIEGAKPKIQRSLPHSNRHVNPLMPEYQLPGKEPEPPYVPPFIRDNINYDDVPGVHPRTYKTDKPPRDIMKTSDITGATKKFHHPRRPEAVDRMLDVTDINKDGVFRSKRTTDPLNPEYMYDGQVLKSDYGFAESNYKSRKGATDFSLKTDDIEGAKADSSSTFYRTFRRTEINTDDAEGVTSLQLPSMLKQDAELLKQRKIDEFRGKRIQKMEDRVVHATRDSTDIVQATLRRQREERKRATFVR